MTATFSLSPRDQPRIMECYDAAMSRGLEVGFILDRRWHLLRGEMERTKRSALLRLAQVMTEARVPYAIIGGLALQVHQADPRTTLDIDVAVTAASQIPRTVLE